MSVNQKPVRAIVGNRTIEFYKVYKILLQLSAVPNCTHTARHALADFAICGRKIFKRPNKMFKTYNIAVQRIDKQFDAVLGRIQQTGVVCIQLFARLQSDQLLTAFIVFYRIITRQRKTYGICKGHSNLNSRGR